MNLISKPPSRNLQSVRAIEQIQNQLAVKYEDNEKEKKPIPFSSNRIQEGHKTDW